MKRNLISLIIIGILFSMSLETYAQDDLSVLNIQGVVRDDKGGAVEDGDYQFTFRIYDSEDGTGDLWSETQTLTVSSGVYSANLGETTTFSSAGLGFDKPYYVGVQFESEAEASPRIRLTAAPYALALQGGDNVFPSSGNVGVNTSAPESQFHVVGNTKIEEGDVSVDGNISLDRADNTTGQTLKFNTGSTTGYSLGQEDNDHFYFWKESTKVMSFHNTTDEVSVKHDFNVDGDAQVDGTINANNLTIDSYAPFVYQVIDLGSGSNVSVNTGVNINDYYCTIIGVIRGTGDIDENGSTNLWRAYAATSSDIWHIYMRGAANSSVNQVKVLWIQSDLVSTNTSPLTPN